LTPLIGGFLRSRPEGKVRTRLCGRPENRRSFKAVAEAFLAAHLGGRYEPVGDDFENSTIEFKVGRELIPGLD
jgi:hypothetical protein